MVGGGVRADELGHEPRELRAVPRPDHADVRRRSVREEVPEPLGDRLERIAGDLVAAAVQDGAHVGNERTGELGDEPRLPRPGLTRHDDRRQRARRAGRVPLLDQNRDLPGAADERELVRGDVE